MWIFTTYGYFSVTRSSQEPDKIQLRARARRHLEALVARHLPGRTILETAKSDYGYRVILTTGEWVACSAAMAAEIDYTNFKNAAHQDTPKDREFIDVLHRVWGLTLDRFGGFGCVGPRTANNVTFTPSQSINRTFNDAFADTQLDEEEMFRLSEEHRRMTGTALAADDTPAHYNLGDLSHAQRFVVKMLRDNATMWTDDTTGEVRITKDSTQASYVLVADRNVDTLIDKGFIIEQRAGNASTFVLTEQGKGN